MALPITIGVPVRNGRAYLQDAIASVLGQSFGDFELIVLDDASGDGSAAIVEALRDPRVRLVRVREPLGIPGSWNRLLAEARGTYVCVFHQDDLMLPGNLALKMQMLDGDPGIAWVHSAVEVRDEGAPVPFDPHLLERAPADWVAPGRSYFAKLVLEGNRVSASSVVMRRAAVERAGGFDPRLHFACDYELWLRLCQWGSVGFIATPAVVYRWHAGNATHAFAGDAGQLEAEHAVGSALRAWRTGHAGDEALTVLQEAYDVLRAERRWRRELAADRDHWRALCARAEERIEALVALRDQRLPPDAGGAAAAPPAVAPAAAPSDTPPAPPAEADAGGHEADVSLPESAGPGEGARRSVLLVIQDFPPTSLGGSELHTRDMAVALSATHDVAVLAGGGRSAEWSLAHESSAPYALYRMHGPFDARVSLRQAYENDAVERLFSDVLDRLAPDVVHFQGIWGLSNRLPRMAHARGAVTVFTLHDFWLMCPRGQRYRPDTGTVCGDIDRRACAACLAPWIAPPRMLPAGGVAAVIRRHAASPRLLWRRIRHRILRSAAPLAPADETERYHALTADVIRSIDGFVAPSEFLRREFIRYGVAPAAIVHEPNGIDTARFRRRGEERSGPLNLAYVGSLISTKGVHLLIEAVASLADGWRLRIFGGPPAGDPGIYMRSLIAQARDPRISFAGPFDPAQAGAIFAGIEVLVLPSLWFENAPLVVLEAFAAGTAVVVPAHGGAAELVQHEVSGLHFRPGSAASLAQQLNRLVREPELVARLRRNTPPVRTAADCASALARHYATLLAHRARRGPTLAAQS